MRFGLIHSPQPHCTHSGAHPGGKVQKLFPEHSFWGKKKKQLCSPMPRQQVPYKSGPLACPSSAGEGPDPWGPPCYQGERGFILLLLQKPRGGGSRSVSDTCALKQSSSPRGSSDPLGVLKKEDPPLCVGRHYPQCRTPEARPQRGVPAASRLY